MVSTTKLLKYTVYASLVVQILTGFSNVWILQFSTPNNVNIIRELIWVELAVQIVEVIFYTWLAYSFFTVDNITPNRYYDWMFTTPTMLVTLISYFIFLKYKNASIDTSTLSVSNILAQEYPVIISICILNAIMLIFGYLGEIGKLATNTSVFAGTIAFMLYFYILFKHYVQDVDGTHVMFYTFVAIWSLYGVAALLPYNWKNISYNILDLFAKNFFGVFLTIVLYQYVQIEH